MMGDPSKRTNKQASKQLTYKQPSHSHQNPKEPNGNEFAMLLANMAKSDALFARLHSLRRGRAVVPAALTSSEMALDQLIELFNKGANGGYNAAANYDYLGYVFADMVQVRSQTRFLARKKVPTKLKL